MAGGKGRFRRCSNVMVILTTLIAPILLKFSLGRDMANRAQ
jgi:hypothetical protein